MGSLSLHTHRVRGKPHAWDPAACLASAETLVAFIRDTLASHHPASTSTPSSGEDHFQDQDDYPVFRVSFDPSSSSSSNDNTRNPPPSSSSSAASTSSPPRPPMAVTIRLLSRAEVDQQVLAGKQEVRSPLPTTTTTTTTKAAGRDRIGFLPRRWVEAVHERRRKRVSSLAAEEAATRASASGGVVADGPNSSSSGGTG